jgi:hypothetical protein
MWWFLGLAVYYLQLANAAENEHALITTYTVDILWKGPTYVFML